MTFQVWVNGERQPDIEARDHEAAMIWVSRVVYPDASELEVFRVQFPAVPKPVRLVPGRVA